MAIEREAWKKKKQEIDANALKEQTEICQRYGKLCKQLEKECEQIGHVFEPVTTIDLGERCVHCGYFIAE